MRSRSLKRRHLAAAGSAQRDESHRLRRIAGRDEIIGEADHLVVEVGGRARRCPSAVGLQRQAPGDFRSALLQRPAKELRREAVPVGSGGKRSERVGDPASVDDRAGLSTDSKSARLTGLWRSTFP